LAIAHHALRSPPPIASQPTVPSHLTAPRLEFVPDHLWKTPVMASWKEEDIQEMLDGARAILEEGAKRLDLNVS
jgi:hypothetical protein